MPAVPNSYRLSIPSCLLCAALLMHGCAAPPSSGVDMPRDAQAAFAAGDFEGAAMLWAEEARRLPPERAGALWVLAADALQRAYQPENALTALRQTRRNRLSADDRARYDLVMAALSLDQGRFAEAGQLLQSAAETLPPSLEGRYDAIYEDLLLRLSGPGTADLAAVEQTIRGLDGYDPTVALQLMRTLESVSSAELAARAGNRRTEPQLAGWLDLALVIRRNLVEPGDIEAVVTGWKSRHPHHLLGAGEALDTWLRYRGGFQPPRRVAAIIPGDGRLKSAGTAIRDGMMTAFTDRPGGAELLFFSTDDNPDSAVSAYFSALDAGADMIVGPVRREDVEALLGVPGLATPVLALNDLPGGFSQAPGTVHALSLSQDDEARSVARHAAGAGYQRSVVLAPDTAWGDRILAAFSDEFLRDGGRILAEIRYPESQNDHSMQLQRALKIDESKQRKRTLENTLGERVEFEPVRRDDVDVIFMAVDPMQARQIRPQLRFHDAGDIPVYATGRAFTGQPDASQNRDLDGVRLPATRWQIENSEPDRVPDYRSLREGARSDLFALGMDAWNLLPWMRLLMKDPDVRFYGQSGTYRRGEGAQFVREPAWATFRNGRPVPLDR